MAVTEFRVAQPVLVVDDDENMLDMIAQVLKSEGYLVIVASNGAEAWIIVQDITPSVILLDMRMPVMDGFEFMQKAREHNLSVPIVAMTATAFTPELQARVEVSDYLSKPFDISDLVSKVAKYQGYDQTQPWA